MWHKLEIIFFVHFYLSSLSTVLKFHCHYFNSFCQKVYWTSRSPVTIIFEALCSQEIRIRLWSLLMLWLPSSSIFKELRRRVRFCNMSTHYLHVSRPQVHHVNLRSRLAILKCRRSANCIKRSPLCPLINLNCPLINVLVNLRELGRPICWSGIFYPCTHTHINSLLASSRAPWTTM